MNTHSHHHHHHPSLPKTSPYALSDPLTEQKENELHWDCDWEIVPRDKWWHTPFSSVSWAYHPKVQIRHKSKFHPTTTQFRGPLFLTETRGTRAAARGRCTKRLSSASSSSSPLRKVLSSSPSTRTLRKAGAHRIAEQAEREEGGEVDEGLLNPDLTGVKTALDSISLYENDVGFHYSPFPDLDLVPRPVVAPLVDLSRHIDEKDVQASKDQWDEMLEDLMNGPAFENTTDSDESLESSFIGSISSSGSADSIPMPSTPKPKSFFTHNDIEIKATSPTSGLDAMHLLHHPNSSINFSPTRSLPLSAAATSFVPTFCSQLNEEPLQLHSFRFASPPSSSILTLPALSGSGLASTAKEPTTSSSSFLNFTFPTLNPTIVPSPSALKLRKEKEKEKENEKEKEKDVHDPDHHTAVLTATDSQSQILDRPYPDSGSNLLPPFLLQEPSVSARSRLSRKSRTREIVDRLRSRAATSASATASAGGGEGDGMEDSNKPLELNLGLISPKKYAGGGSPHGHTQSLGSSPIGGGGAVDSTKMTMMMGFMGTVPKLRLSVSEDGVEMAREIEVEKESEEKGKEDEEESRSKMSSPCDRDHEEDGWIQVSPGSASGGDASVSTSASTFMSQNSVVAVGSGDSQASASESTTTPITTSTTTTDEHEQKAKRTRELFMALRRRRTDSGSSGEFAAKDKEKDATARTTTTTAHSRGVSVISLSASASVCGSVSPSGTPPPPSSSSSSESSSLLSPRRSQSALDISSGGLASASAASAGIDGADDGARSGWIENKFDHDDLKSSASSPGGLKKSKRTSSLISPSPSPSPSPSTLSVSPPPPPTSSASSPQSSSTSANPNTSTNAKVVHPTNTSTSITTTTANPNTKKRSNRTPGRSSVSSSSHSHLHSSHSHPHQHQHQQYFSNMNVNLASPYYPQQLSLSLSPVASSHSHLHPHSHSHSHSHSNLHPHSHSHTHSHSYSHSPGYTHGQVLSPSASALPSASASPGTGFPYFLPSSIAGYPMSATSTSPYAANSFIPLPTGAHGHPHPHAGVGAAGMGVAYPQHHPMNMNMGMNLGMGVGVGGMMQMPMTMSVPHLNMMVPMSMPLQQQRVGVSSPSSYANNNSASGSYRVSTSASASANTGAGAGAASASGAKHSQLWM